MNKCAQFAANPRSPYNYKKPSLARRGEMPGPLARPAWFAPQGTGRNKGSHSMSAHKLGPWSTEDWNSFLALDVELKPPKKEPQSLASLLGGGLLGLGGPSRVEPSTDDLVAREAVIESAWIVRRAHPVYRSLSKEPNFRQAWKIFERHRKAAKHGKLAADTAPFVFLHELVQFAGFAHRIRDSGRRRSYGAHAKQRRSAVIHSKALMELIEEGIKLHDYGETATLRVLLQKLSSQLESTKRKAYEGERGEERWVLKGLAQMLVSSCALQSPGVITHFARMVGIPCESRTAQRYCNEAGAWWEARMAEALAAAMANRK